MVMLSVVLNVEIFCCTECCFIVLSAAFFIIVLSVIVLNVVKLSFVAMFVTFLLLL